MYPEERRREILNLINQSGRVAVTDLSQRFGVSEVTIRADLQALADGGFVIRTHGGAIASSSGLYDLSLTKRLSQQVMQKKRIATGWLYVISLTGLKESHPFIATLGILMPLRVILIRLRSCYIKP